MNRGPEITLQGGPHHGWRYYENDFRDSIQAVKNMGRTDPVNDSAAWYLGYEPAGRGFWQWRGVNCHPTPPAEEPPRAG